MNCAAPDGSDVSVSGGERAVALVVVADMVICYRWAIDITCTRNLVSPAHYQKVIDGGVEGRIQKS